VVPTSKSSLPDLHARRCFAEQVFRDEWGRVLASLIGFLGDFDIAEEAAREATGP